MEALTINIVLQLMDGTKISKTFIPTRYGLKIRQNQLGLATIQHSLIKKITPISSDKPGTIVLSTILRDFLVHTNGPIVQQIELKKILQYYIGKKIGLGLSNDASINKFFCSIRLLTRRVPCPTFRFTSFIPILPTAAIHNWTSS